MLLQQGPDININLAEGQLASPEVQQIYLEEFLKVCFKLVAVLLENAYCPGQFPSSPQPIDLLASSENSWNSPTVGRVARN